MKFASEFFAITKMMNLSCKFFMIYYTVWWFENLSEVYSNTEKALIFNRQNDQLVEMTISDRTAECPFCITACPPSSNSIQEQIINKYASINGSAVVLREVYGDAEIMENMKLSICDQELVPAILWDTKYKIYQIGYELYYEEGRINLECGWYEDFKKIINAEPDPDPRQFPNNNVIQTYIDQNNTKFRIFGGPEPKTFVFYWIRVLSVEVLSNRRQRIIEYIKDKINDYVPASITITYCKKYYLEDGRITDFVITNNRLEKTQIIPMLMFHTLSAKLATCTYMNMAFIWKTIAYGHLQTVDLILYSMYRLWPSRINLIFGVHGKLEGINMDTLIKLRKTEDLLFFKFPIPEIIYRIVRYKRGNESYAVVVVIHNNLIQITKTKRICAEKDEVKSWNKTIIKNTNLTTGFTYVCHLTTDVGELIGFNNKTSVEALNLDDFPESYADTFPYQSNVIEKIDQQLYLIKNLLL